jgi:hypothetical protein
MQDEAIQQASVSFVGPFLIVYTAKPFEGQPIQAVLSASGWESEACKVTLHVLVCFKINNQAENY